MVSTASLRRGRSARAAARLLAAALVTGCVSVVAAPAAQAAGVPAGFRDTVVLSGLNLPTNVAFSPDGRVFVTEKRGTIVAFDSLADTTPTRVADLRRDVYNQGDSGLNGMTLDPQFPEEPYAYVAYAHDAPPGGTAPTWGSATSDFDTCPVERNLCAKLGRVARLTLQDGAFAAQEVLMAGACLGSGMHDINDVQFGPDGALYVSNGDGASSSYQLGGAGGDYGQRGNVCGDPPSAKGSNLAPPTTEGGALKSQDYRTTADPMGTNGTMVRIDSGTGAPFPGNPGIATSADANVQRTIAYGLRNPFRFDFRPGSQEVYVGDVGWDTMEEINLIADADDATVENFGWPCYEGPGRQPTYDAMDVTLCEGLYRAGTAKAPWFGYKHASPTVAGGTCSTTASASNGGVRFYRTGAYPDEYDGALFFNDYSRDCMLVMRPGADGRPDPSTLREFSAQVPNPVDLELGPGGDLFYLDIVAGALHRISYGTTGQAPVAAATASPASGPVGTAVTFDASASRDPEGGDLTYAWDLDADGSFDDDNAPAATRTFDQAGRHEVRVQVTDAPGNTSVATATVDIGVTPPQPTITIAEGSQDWVVGEALRFTGTATDGEDGAVPPSGLTWATTLHHCEEAEGGRACHAHPEGGGTGEVLELTAPDHDAPSYLEITLTARDASGVTATTTVTSEPETVDLTLTSQPEGRLVSFDGTLVRTPATRTVIKGSTHSVGSARQVVDGTSWTPVRWSDGGAATHEVTAGTGDSTLTASFAQDPVTHLRSVNLGGGPLTVDGTRWMGQAEAGVRTTGRTWSTPTLDLFPAPTAERAAMITDAVTRGESNSITVPAVPFGTYDVFVTTYEDSKPVTYDLAVEGRTVVKGGSSGSPGTWARQGPFRVTVADGALDLRTAGGWLNVSGVEVFSVDPVPGTVAVNLGGGPLTIDGTRWLGQAEAGVRTNGKTWSTPTLPLTPKATPERAAMVTDAVTRGSSSSTAVPGVAFGTYDVYVTTYEDSTPVTYDLAVEGRTVVRGGSSGAKGTWSRQGPFRVTVADGALDLRTAGGWLNVSGVEIVPVPAVPGTIAVNLGGGPLTIDGTRWLGQAEAGVRTDGRTWSTPALPLTPRATPERAAMVTDAVTRGGSSRTTVPAVPSGTYDVYVTTYEDSTPVTYDLSLEGRTVVRGGSSGAKGTWSRQGPFRVAVTDGALDLGTAGGWLNVSGVEVVPVR